MADPPAGIFNIRWFWNENTNLIIVYDRIDIFIVDVMNKFNNSYFINFYNLINFLILENNNINSIYTINGIFMKFY